MLNKSHGKVYYLRAKPQMMPNLPFIQYIISEDIRLNAHWQIWLLTADEMKRPIPYLVATVITYCLL